MNEAANQNGVGQAWSDVRGEEPVAVDASALDFHLDLSRSPSSAASTTQ
jgi:hypothetical protein